MGIYDREYYRREGPGFLDSLTTRGKVCKWLIAINVAVFVVQMMTRRALPADMDPFVQALGLRGSSPFTDALLLNVPDVLHGQFWRVLTYAFLHSEQNVYHILFNMLFLWWFGSDVEDLYGPREFLAIYLLSAAAGGLGFVLGYLLDVNGPRCLGASGAVTAVMVLCAFHYPSRIIYLFFLLPVPIWLFVLFQVAQDMFGLLGGGPDRAVAFTGHLGGAAFGALYYLRGWRIVDLMPQWRGWRRSQPRLRVYREQEESPPVVAITAAVPTPPADVDEQLEAKLDAVLAKVAQSGKDSLTDGERQILLRASEVYKRRRS